MKPNDIQRWRAITQDDRSNKEIPSWTNRLDAGARLRFRIVRHGMGLHLEMRKDFFRSKDFAQDDVTWRV